MGALLKATIVMVWKNDFSGTIPDSLGDMSSLLNLDIGYNCLTSTIPSAMSRLSAITLLGTSSRDLKQYRVLLQSSDDFIVSVCRIRVELVDRNCPIMVFFVE
jgi:hypothetical protein